MTKRDMSVTRTAHDAEVLFRQLASRGDVGKALSVLDRLDHAAA